MCLIVTSFPYKEVLFVDAPSSEAPEEPIWANGSGLNRNQSVASTALREALLDVYLCGVSLSSGLLEGHASTRLTPPGG